MKLFNNNPLLKSGILIGFLALMSISFSAEAQCKRFTKKTCFPVLSPFIHNGQLTSAQFMPGEVAEISMTFNAGQDYRILVCSQELIGNVQFRVLSKKRKILYESDKEMSNPFWDFNVANTQQLFIQIIVPEKETSNNIVPAGCVTLLVGFKQ